MKKLLVIAIALTTVNAFATRARMTALGNSVHVIDTQRAYNNPSDIFSFGDYVNLESGATASAGTAKGADSEGVFVRSMGDAKMGFSLGHRSENGSGYDGGLRRIIFVAYPTTAVAHQQNPFEITYGQKSADMTWAGTVVYSSYNDKKNSEKETTAGFRLGGRAGAWDFYWKQGLLNSASRDGQYDYKGKAGTSFFGGYTMDNLYAWGYAEIVEASLEDKVFSNNYVSSVKQNTVKAGVTSPHKKDGNEFFYGASLVRVEQKTDVNPTTTSVIGKTSTTLNMPIIMGMEVDAASWLTLRGSITQDILLSDSKVETSPDTPASNSDLSPGANNTVVAVGAGLKFNKVTVDGTLSGLTGGSATQSLDGNSLLSQVGLTYMF